MSENPTRTSSDPMVEVAQRWSVERARKIDARVTLSTPALSAGRRFWRRFLHERLALAAAIVLVFLVFVAFFGDMIYPIDSNVQNLANSLLPPGSPGHLLGTDVFGRDVLARLVSGTSISLGAAGIAVRFGSRSELHRMTTAPDSRAASSTPRAMLVKNGFSMSDTTKAHICLSSDRSLRATRFG